MKIFIFLSAAMMALPDSTIVKNGNPVYLPDFDSDIAATPYIALKIDRLGKSIAPRFAHRYFGQAAPCLLLTAETELRRLREQGLPWTEAFVFDKSCILGEFITLERWKTELITLDMHERESLELSIPDDETLYDSVSKASERNTLKMGDLILLPLHPHKSLPSAAEQSNKTDQLSMQHDKISISTAPDTLLTISFNSSPILSLPLR